MSQLNQMTIKFFDNKIPSSYFIRWRRDILTIRPRAEYQEEAWEQYAVYIDGRLVEAKRLVGIGCKVTIPLEGWELEAARNQWLPPDEFTYHDKLPERAAAKLADVSE